MINICADVGDVIIDNDQEIISLYKTEVQLCFFLFVNSLVSNAKFSVSMWNCVFFSSRFMGCSNFSTLSKVKNKTFDSEMYFTKKLKELNVSAINSSLNS